MLIFFIAFFVMFSIISAMILGAALLKRPITGSCGGLASLKMKKDCPICGTKSDDLKKLIREDEA